MIAEALPTQHRGRAPVMGPHPLRRRITRIPACTERPTGARAGLAEAFRLAGLAELSAELVDVALPLAVELGHAVMALRRAEKMSPHHVLRNPFVPDVLAELLVRRSRRDAVGVELRGHGPPRWLARIARPGTDSDTLIDPEAFSRSCRGAGPRDLRSPAGRAEGIGIAAIVPTDLTDT